MDAFSSRVEKLKFRTKATAKSFNYSQPTKTCLKSTVETRKMTFNKQRQSPGLVHIKDILKDSTDFTEKLFGEFFCVSKKVFIENMCSSEFRKIFRNSCSTELLWKLASILELRKALPENVNLFIIDWSNSFTHSFRFFQYTNCTNIVYLLESVQTVGVDRITFLKHEKPVFILRYKRPH